MVGARTGTPVEVRMVVTSVGEKCKLEFALAAPNLASTRPGSASGKPRSILVVVEDAMGMVGGTEGGEGAPKIACTVSLQTSRRTRPHH